MLFRIFLDLVRLFNVSLCSTILKKKKGVLCWSTSYFLYQPCASSPPPSTHQHCVCVCIFVSSMPLLTPPPSPFLSSNPPSTITMPLPTFYGLAFIGLICSISLIKNISMSQTETNNKNNYNTKKHFDENVSINYILARKCLYWNKWCLIYDVRHFLIITYK